MRYLRNESADNHGPVSNSCDTLRIILRTIKGIEDRAKEINPDVQVTSVSADYDLNKQVSQIDNFIAAGVDIIMLNAVDAKAIAPAVKRAQKVA